MLFIFRKLRKSFFLPGKVRTYLAYAVGEIVLIVVGILIALQISEWNQTRKDHAEEQQILIGLERQFEQQLEQLELKATRYNTMTARIRELLNSPSIDELPITEIESGLGSLLWAGTFDPGSGTLEAVLSSGRLELIESHQLRNQLAEWNSILVETMDNEIGMRDFVFTIFVPRLASLGIEVSGAISTHGPERWDILSEPDPQAYRSILRNSEFRSLAQYRYNWTQLSSREFQRTADSCRSILEVIRLELGKK